MSLGAAVQSRTCLADDHLTGLPYPGNIKLSTCHLEGLFGQTGLRWLFNKHHSFINSFYVYCYDKDEPCNKSVQEHRGTLDKVASASLLEEQVARKERQRADRCETSSLGT